MPPQILNNIAMNIITIAENEKSRILRGLTEGQPPVCFFSLTTSLIKITKKIL